MKNRKFQIVELTIVFVLVFFGSLIFFTAIEPVKGSTRQLVNQKGVNDLLFDFQVNQSKIGRHNGALATLNITNQGINPVSDVSVTFNLTGNYGLLSNKYPAQQEIALINPGSAASMNIEVMLNLTQEPSGANAADVCLLFDSSGSMQDEIASVKEKFLEITDRLTQEIPSLRIGMIVYGWSHWSEYPTSSSNNYIEFTEDIDAINNLIQQLYASGSIEPWGDAFSIANSWEWRPDVPKLAIIVGDEDCDPGKVVGVGHSGENYNGSALLDVITGLKEKGVQINTVITGISGIVENQFHWIAEYTEGECVYLEELQSGENPIDLPELIEYWTLNLVREYYLELTADISWIELDPGGNLEHSVQETLELWVDLAPPSISYTTFTSQEPNGNFSFEIYAVPKDLSGIESTNLYWTPDDLESEPDPTWHFKIMQLLNDNRTYFASITSLTGGQPLSFYIESMDTLGNVGETIINNVTIVIEPIDPGTTTEFLFTQDNSSRTLFYSIELGTKGFLWFQAEQDLGITFNPVGNFIFSQVFADEESTIYKVTPQSSEETFSVTVSGDMSSSSIKIRWVFEESLTQEQFNYKSEYLDTTLRNILWKVELTDPSNGYLSLIIESTELVVIVHVFTAGWVKIGNVTAAEALEISAGTYYLWAIEIVREGYFSMYYGEEPITTSDPYHTAYVTTQYGCNALLIVGVVILCLGLIRVLKAKKRKSKTD